MKETKKVNFVNMLSTSSILKNASLTFLFFLTSLFATGQNEKIDTTEYLLPYFDMAYDYNLMIAASKGYSSEIDRLVKLGANVNTETVEGATALIFAVANNQTDALKTLLAYSPDVDKVTNDYQTPLLLAVKNQNVEITEILIRAGADINKTDNYGAAPLHYASAYGSFYVTDVLLYYNADVDKKSDDGTTPLMAAVWAGYADVADLLIQNGANMEARDDNGFTPFLIASQNGDTLLMKVLLKFGVDLYEKNIYNYNALDLAIESDHKPAVELLLEKGDKWGSNENHGVNPYRIASAFGRKDYLQMLENKGIPGKVRPSVSEMAVEISSRFTPKDLYGSIRLSFKEPLFNGGFTAGVDTKMWYSRVLTKDSENVYYQYMDKSSVLYAGFFKDFRISDGHKKSILSATTSISAGYTFGNKLKGTNIEADNRFLVIPSAGLKLQRKHFILSTGIEYIKSPYYHIGPVWFRLGCSYNFYLSRVSSPGKKIKWY